MLLDEEMAGAPDLAVGDADATGDAQDASDEGDQSDGEAPEDDA